MAHMEARNRLQVAEDDTRILHTDSYWGDILGQLYGFPRPPRWQQTSWLGGLREIAFGRRETFGVWLDALEEIFSFTAPYVTFDVAFGTNVLEGDPGDFTCAWEHRWLRVTDSTGSTQRVLTGAINGDGSEIEVASQKVLGSVSLTLTGNGTARVLPFWVQEDPVRPLVTVYLDAEMLGFVGSYLFPAGARDASLEGIGGILMPDGTVSGAGVPAIYLSGIGAADALKYALSLISQAGVKVEVKTVTWCADESLGLPSLP